MKAGGFSYHFGTLFYLPAESEEQKSPDDIRQRQLLQEQTLAGISPGKAGSQRDFRAPGSA